MAEQKVELRKVRDFSENLNDTFLFIKQNFKPLLTSFLGIAGVFMLANSVVSGLYQSEMGGVFRDIFYGANSGNDVSPLSIFSGTYFLVIILTWCSVTAMQVSIVSYLKVYELKGGEYPTIQEVWEEFKNHYLKVLLYTIPIYLLMFVGLFLCLAPGFYFAVVLMPFSVVLIVENASFSGAFSRCFAIIKDNFWASFLLYFVVYIIYAIASGIISLVMGGISGLLAYFTTGDVGATMGIITSVLSVLSFVFYIVFYVSVTLHYFNLTEKYDGTGMMQRLDKLGESGNDYNNIQEQY